MSESCPHTGRSTEKFGGSIVCEDCHTVIGNWRERPMPTTANDIQIFEGLEQGDVRCAQMVARRHQDGHHLRALARGDEWSDRGLVEDIDNVLSESAGRDPRGENAEGERAVLRALRTWALNHTTIISVWSSHGHRFHSSDGHESCFTCGARYELVHDEPDNPSHGRYRTANGDDPTECTGDTSMSHGDAHESGHGLECEDGCEHCRHTCNCLLCTG